MESVGYSGEAKPGASRRPESLLSWTSLMIPEFNSRARRRSDERRGHLYGVEWGSVFPPARCEEGWPNIMRKTIDLGSFDGGNPEDISWCINRKP